MADFWKPTSDAFSSLIDKPKMTQKLLSKPPFRYLFDIIMETMKKTKFANGLYPGNEMNIDHYNDRDRKIEFLQKIIKLIELMDGSTQQAKPARIVAGMDAEATNVMLLALYKCATNGKSSDPYVKKVLGGGGNEQEEQKKKQPQKKKIERPPSAARKTKPQQQQPQKKVEPEQQEQLPQVKKQPEQKPKKQVKQEYSKQVKEIMQEGEDEANNQKQTQKQDAATNKNKLGKLNKKKKGGEKSDKIISSGGQLNQKQLQMVQSMIQSICQNTAPLGKSIQFINDDVQAMNKQLQFWRKQYNASKLKMQAELKITEDSLLPVYDKIAQIQDQIKDQKAKIQNAKAQILKNGSTIKDLLMSVVTTK